MKDNKRKSVYRKWKKGGGEEGEGVGGWGEGSFYCLLIKITPRRSHTTHTQHTCQPTIGREWFWGVVTTRGSRSFREGTKGGGGGGGRDRDRR